ncbi:MAG: CHAT domain-containing protein [Acidobacteria bacterium]|nr:CHAT domain-containing protein [Acidobacteriota bacterium]
MRSKHELALKRYEAALSLFERTGQELDLGRTLNGALQPLIYLGQYEKAFSWAERARNIFEKHGDSLRLARLETNFGNVLYRQDRFAEALQHYHRAEKALRRLGEPQDVAAVLSNIAVCHISLNDFQKALYAYQKARSYCQTHNLPLFVVQADYNVAYLHYLRGEYTRAIELYDAARKQSELLNDRYHKALCDLDQSEMYLELNLVEEGGQLAQQAFFSFEDLRMGYEAAKALAFLAIAHSQQGKTGRALDFFRDARQRFVREQNRVWPALIDLYQALVLYQAERYTEARRLCAAAFRFFARTSLSNKTVLCELLLARLLLQTRKSRQALKQCRSALKKLERVEAPTLRYQAYFVLGQIQEALGQPELAYEAYEEAHAGLESLRSHLSGEELKISFLKDKLAVYESLVWLSLTGRPAPSNLATAFAYIEYAKSRSLADLIAFRAQALSAHTPSASPLVERVRRLREALTWHYRQIDLHETGQQPGSPEHLERLRRETRESEAELLRALKQLRATEREFSSLQNAGTLPLEAIRHAIPADSLLLEYYQARGTLFVALLGRDLLEILPLGPASRARNLLRLLQFQLSKFRLGAEYVRSTSGLLLQATEAHLRELYQELVAPVRPRLGSRHLIVVPHDFLHYLPFHALFDGQGYLIDAFSISYAPSASVYQLCGMKKTPAANQSLVLGVPDPLAPHILDEVQAVASALPQARLFVGQEANEECLKTFGPQSRFVHIATHGLFRQDNPMFSSLRLGTSQLTLFDLYNLELPAELVTLSGCGTGLNLVVGGDELLGLVRGLLYAGAQALLVTLWDVNDISTAEFMKSFYHCLQAQPDKAMAVQSAMRELRQSFPHPYYWAPFALIGKANAN